MRVTWRFLLLPLLGLALPAGCDRKPEPVHYDLDGTWAWADTVNCYGNENTIVFSGKRIQVFEHGVPKVSVSDAEIREEVLDGKPLLTVRYTIKERELEIRDFEDHRQFEDRDFTEQYLALDADTLQPLETEMDGKAQISAGSDKRLVRCPAEALTPAPAPAPAPAG